MSTYKAGNTLATMIKEHNKSKGRSECVQATFSSPLENLEAIAANIQSGDTVVVNNTACWTKLVEVIRQTRGANMLSGIVFLHREHFSHWKQKGVSSLWNKLSPSVADKRLMASKRVFFIEYTPMKFEIKQLLEYIRNLNKNIELIVTVG